MATESPQRAYRAPCPNCGAPVDFASAASAFAVCSFCRSTVVRDGDALRKIGESAELFDDHSPLQLGAAGRYQGAPFTLIGRLQYRSSEGSWNEWHALFDSPDGQQRRAWLSEDNGRYVLALDAPLAETALPAQQLQVGAAATIGGQRWTVASVTTAHLLAVQGELPAPPVTDREFTVVDLRNERGEVATLDYGDPAAPVWSLGRSVALSELALTGLAEPKEKTLAGRSLECPNCGAPLAVKLDSTQSVVCGQCHAVVDVSQGVAGELQHFAQAAPPGHAEPQIPLGSTGTLALGTATPLAWQVVGYVERCEVAQSADDEQSVWREYLLYHRTAGFAFIVDAEDGWSWSAPITGVPSGAGSFGQEDSVQLDGVSYRKLYDYVGRVTYVLGEFYWRLTRDQQTDNTDYQGTSGASSKRLNRERTREAGAEEIVWSAGETLSAEAVLKAFRLAPDKAAALQRDVTPMSRSGMPFGVKLMIALLVIAIVFSIVLASRGGKRDCSESLSTFGEASQEYADCLASQRSGSGMRTGGGSFGGFSTGGGHK